MAAAPPSETSPPERPSPPPLPRSASAVRSSSNHYGALADAQTYDDAYFSEPGAYMEHLATVVRDRLRLTPRRHPERDRPSRCILDIGGGTGTFAKALVRDESIHAKVVVVEPFLGPRDHHGNGNDNGNNIVGNGKVSFVKAPAEDFLVPPTEDSWRTSIVDRHHGGYDQILLKEVVHHFSEEDRVGIFRGLREGLRRTTTTTTSNENNGSHQTEMPSLLIVTRPQTDIDYPLWDEARRVWARNQPSVETIEDDLRTAGYTVLERSVEAVECSIALSRWQSMVKSRCWSTFSSFTDDELETACAAIAEEARTRRTETDGEPESDDPILRFEDRLILLVA